eukprot:369448_1
MAFKNNTESIEIEHDHADSHWQHECTMFIAFGVIFVVSMTITYFGQICHISRDVRKQCHFIGFLLTFIVCIIGFVLDVFVVNQNGAQFNTNHAIIGISLLCTMVALMLIFCVMRQYKIGLKIWCDFIVSFMLLSWSFIAMLTGLFMIDNSNYFVYGLITWFCVVCVVFVALSISIYLTQSEWSMIIARGDDMMFDDDVDDNVHEEARSLTFNSILPHVLILAL